MASFSGYVNLMCLSSLIRALHDINCPSLLTGLRNPYRCLSSVLPLSEAMHHIHTHFRETARAHYTSNQLAMNFRLCDTLDAKKTESHCVLSTFSHVCSRPAISILIAGRSDMLTLPTCDCMTTQTLLHGSTTWWNPQSDDALVTWNMLWSYFLIPFYSIYMCSFPYLWL